MSVICISSLKGGVGKTSVCLNLAHSFSKRGCKTLLIDLDPAAHLTRYLKPKGNNKIFSSSSLASLFLYKDLEKDLNLGETFFDIGNRNNIPVTEFFRPELDITRGGEEIRCFYWGNGQVHFCKYFPMFLRECEDIYDYIILDTAPDLNVVTRNAASSANLIIVPVDSSMMSICSLEELVIAFSHLKKPVWSVLKTMVNKRASRLNRLIEENLERNESVIGRSKEDNFSYQDYEECFDSNSLEDFKKSVREYEIENKGLSDKDGFNNSVNKNDNPIYLLNSVIYRTEDQNRLSFLRKTSLDREETKKLALNYLELAREVEELLSMVSNDVQGFEKEEFSLLTNEVC